MSVTNIVILTGAGISAESGLATFRGPGGLREGHRVEDVCTPEALAYDPELVHRFYDARRAALAGVEPNAAHRALAALDAAWAGDLLLVTQNVDDLHERAGSRRLLHMHGQLNSALCAACGERRDWSGDLPPGTACPDCGEPAFRPDIVFFGEMPYDMDAIDAALSRCDLFVSIGTSGAVYPAAGFVRTARHGGAATLELNLEPSAGSIFFGERRFGPATQVVPEWVRHMLELGTSDDDGKRTLPIANSKTACRMKHPEARFIVEVTLDDELACRAPEQPEQRIRMADVRRFMLRQTTAALGELTSSGY